MVALIFIWLKIIILFGTIEKFSLHTLVLVVIYQTVINFVQNEELKTLLRFVNYPISHLAKPRPTL